MTIRTVAVCGSGVLGSQIAFQTAFHGFGVRVYDVSDEAITRARATMQGLTARYQQDLQATPEQTQAAQDRLSFFTDLAGAVRGADLVIEAIPEVIGIKRDFYQKLGTVADPQTIFATNTSTLLPSDLMEATGRPGRFLALHFANQIWVNNTAEIMRTPRTDDAVFDQVVAFAQDIGMVALPLHKEQPGYILNTLLVPLLGAALELVVKGVADPHTVDKTWMVATGAPRGPFAILDVIGLTTPYNINMAAAAQGDAGRGAVAEYLKGYIDRGKLGVATGEGFYTYPNPAYLREDFLK
ncbi:3-hydroxybutyryl-CoA dehydrogenase [Deinococcus budaensis]|uniref:3-hydroxybutyryl-CoA dehydrogenase n=2 Tax=Deinococcus budaensis TaxID=1665626 RepID=A0A7W8LQM7_9DEIO|nr:3-hydroxyacyl-CoA dehydrogenase [Deinococcus budaensis]MBB5234770.1 3-hydroxybutyryl-CoA dehydrogenase [Deinococcus budaensis]